MVTLACACNVFTRHSGTTVARFLGIVGYQLNNRTFDNVQWNDIRSIHSSSPTSNGSASAQSSSSHTSTGIAAGAGNAPAPATGGRPKQGKMKF